MTAVQTARARARAELTGQIKDEARRQLASSGAGGLSLRSVARELGIAASAIYRYFPNRDALLTGLLVDAFNALGAAVEKAAKQSPPVREPRIAWRAACAAVRTWAKRHPHEYALIHGTPVPGYQAPQDTVEPAARTPLALLAVVRDARYAGWIVEPPEATAPRGELHEQLAPIVAANAPEVPVAVLARTMVAWSQLFGMVSFELFGALVGSADPADEFFDYSVERMADFLGFVV
ncbi:TetR/AcrR family transcriptional regulator [Sciscionella sediminilitoris]|uniref:TetR/AcrR family transcriptional regulator n=1 Tax=Sciscionella sediminilitoris TaxID=1445613 RepID=UPI0004DFB379|nr:TetR/AcrR family transcriptional regulator [Sciscionella sp. SE31]